MGAVRHDDVHYSGFDVLTYYFTIWYGRFDEYAWVVQMSYSIIIFALFIILAIGVSMIIQAKNYWRNERYTKKLNDEWRPELTKILQTKEPISSVEIADRLNFDGKELKWWKTKNILRLLVDIKRENEDAYCTTNVGTFALLCSLRNRLESKLLSGVRADKPALLHSIQYVGLQIPESILVRLLNSRNPSVRKAVKMYYIANSDFDPFRFFEKGERFDYCPGDAIELHAILQERFKRDGKIPSFQTFIFGQPDENLKACLIREVGYWGSDQDVAAMGHYFLHESIICREAAFACMGTARSFPMEIEMIKTYSAQNEHLRRCVLRSILKIRSGRQLNFLESAYRGASSLPTRIVALECIRGYGEEGVARFEYLKSTASEEDRLIFDNVTSVAREQSIADTDYRQVSLDSQNLANAAEGLDTSVYDPAAAAAGAFGQAASAFGGATGLGGANSAMGGAALAAGAGLAGAALGAGFAQGAQPAAAPAPQPAPQAAPGYAPQPAPAYTEPAPAYAQPAPSYTEPAPAYASPTPQPTAAPAPTAPAEPTVAPAPAYSEPVAAPIAAEATAQPAAEIPAAPPATSETAAQPAAAPAPETAAPAAPAAAPIYNEPAAQPAAAPSTPQPATPAARPAAAPPRVATPHPAVPGVRRPVAMPGRPAATGARPATPGVARPAASGAARPMPRPMPRPATASPAARPASPARPAVSTQMPGVQRIGVRPTPRQAVPAGSHPLTSGVSRPQTAAPGAPTRPAAPGVARPAVSPRPATAAPRPAAVPRPAQAGARPAAPGQRPVAPGVARPVAPGQRPAVRPHAPGAAAPRPAGAAPRPAGAAAPGTARPTPSPVKRPIMPGKGNSSARPGGTSEK